MVLPIILAVLGLFEPPDPASVRCTVGVMPEGILVTDGRDAGLSLALPDGGLVVLSDRPGAGRNVTVMTEGILFKECLPEGQRVILADTDGNLEVLFRADCFSGPFPAGEGLILVFHEGSAVVLDLSGAVTLSRSVGEHPARGTVCTGEIWFTGETGGLKTLSMTDGSVREDLPDLSDVTFSRLETGPGGLLLAVRSDGGFFVIDPASQTVVETVEGLDPSWTPDGRIVCSVLAYEGLSPVSGYILLLDPVIPDRDIRPVEGVPVSPSVGTDGSLVYTDLETGMLVPGPEAEPVGQAAPYHMDDPQVHFDVPYMHQRWDTPDWFNGSWSCGPTSCTMTVQFYRMLPPDSIWASSPSPGHWSPWGNYIPEEYAFLGYTYDLWGLGPGDIWVQGAHGYICREYGGAVWNYMVSFLQQHQVTSAWAGQGWSTLTGELDSGYPVVCSSSVLGSGHIILFNGYYSDHTVIVNDPYGDANQSGWGSHYNGKDVLYDWPGYNNGHVEIGVNQLFTAQAVIPPEADTLVDDRSTGFEKTGDAEFWHLADGFADRAWWTWSTAAPPDTCVGRWTPVLPEPGSYTVSIYIPPDHATSTVIYRVETSSGIEEIALDQGAFSGEWADLGTWWFNADAQVVLGDYTGTGGEWIAFDAVRFTRSGTGVSEGPAPVPMGILRAFPNPCRGAADFSFPGSPSDRSLALMDLSGRVIASEPVPAGRTGISLVTAGLPTGVYLARLSGSGEERLSALLTVIR